MKRIIVFTLMFFTLYGCKSRSTVVNENEPEVEVKIEEQVKEEVKSSTVSSTTIIERIDKAHNNINRNFKTAQIISNLDYKDASMDQSVKADIRIEKDKQILIVVKAYLITVAKVYITPNRLSYYEIINGTHYDGDFKFLNSILGTDVSYNQVENIFLGKTLFPLTDNKFELTIEKNQYKLDKIIKDFVLTVFMNGKSELLSESFQNKDVKFADLKYAGYQEINGVVFPKKWNLQTMQLHKMNVNLEYNKIELNNQLNFKYEIPSGSKAVKF